MKTRFYFSTDITDSAIGQYVSLIPRMHDLCVCGSFFLIECRGMELYELKRFLLNAWWPCDAIWVDTSWLSFVQVRLVAVHVSIMDGCLIRTKTSTHWSSGDVTIFSVMPFSNTLKGLNVEQFLSNYPDLNTKWPHWNTNKSPWHLKNKSNELGEQNKTGDFFYKTPGLKGRIIHIKRLTQAHYSFLHMVFNNNDNTW